MHLAHVHVKNFRNLRELSVQLSPGLNVVVGRNNIGKTNLFDAIRHCLGPVSSLGENLWLTDDDFTREGDGSCNFAPIEISLTFEQLSGDQEAQFFEILDVDLNGNRPTQAILHFEATWDPDRRRVRNERWGGPDSSDRPAVPQEILAALPVTFLPALRDAELALQPGRRSRLALLLRDLIERSDAEGSTAVGTAIQDVFTEANSKLLDVPTLKLAAAALSGTTKELAGIDHVPFTFMAGEPY